MTGIEKLLIVARAYAEAAGVGMSAVSWRVFGDTKKLRAIEGGADIQIRRFERAMSWFSENWPSDATWPIDVERPSPSIVPDQPEPAEVSAS